MAHVVWGMCCSETHHVIYGLFKGFSTVATKWKMKVDASAELYDANLHHQLS